MQLGSYSNKRLIKPTINKSFSATGLRTRIVVGFAATKNTKCAISLWISAPTGLLTVGFSFARRCSGLRPFLHHSTYFLQNCSVSPRRQSSRRNYPSLCELVFGADFSGPFHLPSFPRALDVQLAPSKFEALRSPTGLSADLYLPFYRAGMLACHVFGGFKDSAALHL